MIVKHVIIAKKPTDFRNSGKNHYECTCDHCGQLFWPKRSDAMFCNSYCAAEFRKKYLNVADKPIKTAKKALKFTKKEKDAIRAKIQAKVAEKNKFAE